jgi:hypothetical protein
MKVSNIDSGMGAASLSLWNGRMADDSAARASLSWFDITLIIYS